MKYIHSEVHSEEYWRLQADHLLKLTCPMDVFQEFYTHGTFQIWYFNIVLLYFVLFVIYSCLLDISYSYIQKVTFLHERFCMKTVGNNIEMNWWSDVFPRFHSFLDHWTFSLMRKIFKQKFIKIVKIVQICAYVI